MFGKKKGQNDKKSSLNDIKKIRVIPEEFYGGKDPVIYHPSSAGKVSSVKDLKAQDIKKPVQGVVVSRFAGRKFMIISVGIVFVLGIGIGSVYYLRPMPSAQPAETNVPVVQVEAPVPVVEVPTTTTEIIPEVETVAVVTTTVPGELEFPKLQSADAADMDSDALTDFEEESFGTDPALWDTDTDGYYDGQELVNLYNPRGFAPVKLIDSGLVTEYVNPVQQYRVYYPINWQVGEVDSSAKQVLFSTITGDYIELSIFDMNATENFTDWFTRMAKGEQYTDVSQFTNRFGEAGYKRKDGLVAYFVDSGKVFVFIYHPSASQIISYRHVMQMMYGSFRPRKSNVEIPNQVMLPGVVNPETITTSTFEVNTSTIESESVSSTAGSAISAESFG